MSSKIHQIFLMSASGMLLYYREFQSIPGVTTKPDFNWCYHCCNIRLHSTTHWFQRPCIFTIG
eukprot:UN02229